MSPYNVSLSKGIKHNSGYLTSSDNTRLYYQTWLPETDPPHAILAVVHGWSEHSGRYTNLVNGVVPNGFGVHAIDLRGNGESDGQRGHVNAWADYRNDIHTFLTSVLDTYSDTDVPVFLFGHSLGGLAVMDYIIHHPNVPINGLISSSPLLAEPKISKLVVFLLRRLSNIMPTLSLDPNADAATISRDPDWVAHITADPLGHERTTPRTAVEMEVARDFVLSNLDAITLPFLVIYGNADGLVPQETTRNMFEHIGADDKTRYEYDGGYHELINDIDKEQVFNDLCEWMTARL